MVPSPSGPVFVDTTVLSNFASTNGTGAFHEILGTPVVVESVRRELQDGVEYGHAYLESAVEYVDSELTVKSVETDVRDESGIHDRLDRGEADALWAAREAGGTLATDDLAARRLAAEAAVPVTGSIGVLALGVSRGVLTTETADSWLAMWRAERGYYAPVESVSEVLD